MPVVTSAPQPKLTWLVILSTIILFPPVFPLLTSICPFLFCTHHASSSIHFLSLSFCSSTFFFPSLFMSIHPLFFILSLTDPNTLSFPFFFVFLLLFYENLASLLPHVISPLSHIIVLALSLSHEASLLDFYWIPLNYIPIPSLYSQGAYRCLKRS